MTGQRSWQAARMIIYVFNSIRSFFPELMQPPFQPWKVDFCCPKGSSSYRTLYACLVRVLAHWLINPHEFCCWSPKSWCWNPVIWVFKSQWFPVFFCGEIASRNVFFIVKSHGYITCFSHVKSHFCRILSWVNMGKLHVWLVKKRSHVWFGCSSSCFPGMLFSGVMVLSILTAVCYGVGRRRSKGSKGSLGSRVPVMTSSWDTWPGDNPQLGIRWIWLINKTIFYTIWLFNIAMENPL